MVRIREWFSKLISFGGMGTNGVALINLLLAIVAFGKDLMQATYFGTSPSADALTLAFFIPDTVGNNLLASAIGVACVPMFCKLLVQRETKRLQLLFIRVTVYTFLFSGGCFLLFYLFQNPLLHWLGQGFTPEVYSQCKHLLMILLPTMVLFPLWMIGSAALQAKGMYVRSAFTPVVFNSIYLGAIACLFVQHVSPDRGAIVVAVGIFIGVCSMVMLVWLGLHRKGDDQVRWYRYDKNIWQLAFCIQDDFIRVLRTFVPYLMILLSTQLVLAVERNIASKMESGTIAGLNYAFRLAQFPNWVFVAALTTVLLPSISKAVGENNLKLASAAMNSAVKMTLIITVPVTVIFFLGRIPLISLLFQHGSFDQHSVQITSNILAGYSLAIVSQALSAVGMRYFMAVERMIAPTIISFIALLVNVVCDQLLTFHIGAAGLGYGAACGALVNASGIMLFAYRDLRKYMKVGAEYEPLPNRHSFF
ncbi:murein biosynthesis integral membrane protein MurJ [Aneurinibacillus soli]|uniref:Putative peptidoglycan biosynthesis protein MurJ n=1 Tax=Aneurinibacillus soli TaxID=1500254 RepID=A0A0U5BFF0_9BACL|nr:lipid II flippase MurJ [Aneurinibacillus soli]PYE61892.1 murein biosynthesis integral membrane protein MurJ [Aneurinibacillus soli]BAU29708.1 putative peptidoglycan biosynthesis protein MurJ [Aneurinibacillus soli]